MSSPCDIGTTRRKRSFALSTLQSSCQRLLERCESCKNVNGAGTEEEVTQEEQKKIGYFFSSDTAQLGHSTFTEHLKKRTEPIISYKYKVPIES